MTTWTVLTGKQLAPAFSGTACPASSSGWDRLCRLAVHDSGPAGRLARMRRRIDAFLAGMLDDDPDGPGQEAGPVVGVHRDEPAERAAPEARPAAGHRSKHRLTEPLRDTSPDDGRRSRPRHASPH